MVRLPMSPVLLVLPLLPGLLSAPAMGAENAADSVSVTDAYVRAVPPGQTNSAAFMKLQNTGGADHALIGAASPVAMMVELHTHLQEDGMMKMREVDKIDVPSQGEAVLQPGGLHVMLMGLKGELGEGKSVPLTLSFEDGSKKEIEAPVRKMQMKMDMPMHKHDH